MAGYKPSSFFACLCTEMGSRSTNPQNQASISCTLIVSYAEIDSASRIQAALRFRQFSRYSAEWQTMIKILSLSVVS